MILIRPQVIKLFSFSTQLSTKFILIIIVKKPTIVGILTFISIINTTSERLKARNFFCCRYFSLYEQLKKFYILRAWWLNQKSADLDLQCFQKRKNLDSAGQGLEQIGFQNQNACFYAPEGTLGGSSNRTVRPASCPVHISFILRGRNSKFG